MIPRLDVSIGGKLPAKCFGCGETVPPGRFVAMSFYYDLAPLDALILCEDCLYKLRHLLQSDPDVEIPT